MEYLKESISFELGFIVLISSNLYVMNFNTDVINFSTKKLKQKNIVLTVLWKIIISLNIKTKKYSIENSSLQVDMENSFLFY